MPTELFYTKFLPFIDNYNWCNTRLGEPTLYNMEAISNYLEIPYSTIRKYFKQAEEKEILQFIRKTRTVDDEVIAKHGLKEYRLSQAKADEYINLFDGIYYYTEEERWTEHFKYFKATRLYYLDPAEVADHAEKNKIYLAQNGYYADLVDNINEHKPAELHTRYLKQGVNRETNILCTTVNPEKHPDHPRAHKREEILHEVLGIKTIAETDIKSSIYRDNYNLTHKSLLPHDVDVYQEVWNLAKFRKILTPAIRNSFKQVLMPLYMKDGKTIGYWSGIVNGVFKDDHPSKNKINREAIEACTEYLNIKATEFLSKTVDALKEFLGEEHLMGGEIFIYESDIHIEMLNHFWENGIKIQNVYDGFYYDAKDLKDEDVLKAHDKATKDLIKRRNVA